MFSLLQNGDMMKIEGIIAVLILLSMIIFLGISMIFNLVNDIIVIVGGFIFIGIAIYMMFNFKNICEEITK